MSKLFLLFPIRRITMAHHVLRTAAAGLLFVLAVQLSAAQHDTCRTPSNQELAHYLSAGSSLPESFYQFPELRRTVYNDTETLSIGKDSTFYDAGENCSESRNGVRACPLMWVFNYDPLRYPDTLVEARCKCEKDVPQKFSCEPVHYYTKVLRRDDCNKSTGIYTYSQTFEQITISCALKPARQGLPSGRIRPESNRKPTTYGPIR